MPRPGSERLAGLVQPKIAVWVGAVDQSFNNFRQVGTGKGAAQVAIQCRLNLRLLRIFADVEW